MKKALQRFFSLLEEIFFKKSHRKEDYREIIETLVEGVVSINTYGWITATNQTACKLLGITNKAIVCRNFFSLEKKSSLIQKCQEMILQSQKKNQAVTDSWVVGKGKKSYLDLQVIPLRENKGTLLVIQDKTNDYERVEREKDFVANASHELRTPVTVIKGFTEMIKDNPEIPPEILKEIAEKLVRTSERLTKLITNLLTLANLEQSATHRFASYDLGQIAEHCCSLLRDRYADVELEYQKEGTDFRLHADSGLIELAITNLLENAVKYSSSPAKITVVVSKRGSDVRVKVQDRGKGIPSAYLEKIFDRFYTIEKAQQKKSPSAGLGLSIVRSIMEKHQGRVSVSSVSGEHSPNKGSCFTLIFPQGIPS